MQSSLSALPRDVRSLRRMIVEKEALLSEREQIIVEKEAQLAERDRLIAVRDAELYSKTLQIEHLKAQLAVLRRARFGRSSEKLDREIEQLELLIGDLEQEAAEAQARATTNQHARTDADPPAQPRERRHPTRTPLPAHLPRETITHEPACTCPGCGGSLFSRIGQDEREVLEYVPSSFKVIRHVRPKLSCRACETIVQAPMPSLPIERGRPGPGLIAHVAVAKFADHIPLHRQATMYAREGVQLDRATLADWMGPAAVPLSPLAEVACWSHVRRKFYDVNHAVASATALEAMQRIAALFAIESRIRGQSPERRVAVRQQHARPLLDQLKKFLDTALGRVSGKSTLAQAIRYALSRWQALERYLTDGRLEMSNNAAERAMKSPVLGRKNYL